MRRRRTIVTAAFALSLMTGCDDGADADPTSDAQVVDAESSGADMRADQAVDLSDMATLMPDVTVPDMTVLDMAGPDMMPDMAAPEMGLDPNGTFLGEWCQNDVANFSFFVISMNALWTFTGDAIDDWAGGLGGDLGGIEGADALCQTVATATGHGHKTWRAFLSATAGPDGQPVHAIQRIGEGPWYDANGRLVSENLQGLLAGDRPQGDAQSVNDLPDECGVPLSVLGDSHDTLTGSDPQGMLANPDPEFTCNDWKTTEGGVGEGGRGGGGVRIGHSWPRQAMGGGGGRGGAHWISDHNTRGCSKGANLIQNGGGTGTCVGCGGGYGQWYCLSTDGGSM